MSDLKFGLIGASYVAASRMIPAFQANGISPKALFDSEKERFRYWRDTDVDLLTIRLRLLVCSIDKAEEVGLDWWRPGSPANLGAPPVPVQRLPRPPLRLRRSRKKPGLPR